MRFSYDDFRKRGKRFPPYAVQFANRSKTVVAIKTRHYYEWDLNPRYARYELAALSNYAIICCCECLCVSCVPQQRLASSSAQNADTQESSDSGHGEWPELRNWALSALLPYPSDRSWKQDTVLYIRDSNPHLLGPEPSTLPLS